MGETVYPPYTSECVCVCVSHTHSHVEFFFDDMLMCVRDSCSMNGKWWEEVNRRECVHQLWGKRRNVTLTIENASPSMPAQQDCRTMEEDLHT